MTVPSPGDAALGRRLRELREWAKWTQRAVGDALGGERPLSAGLISSWESGKAVPSRRWVTRYAEVFAGPDGRGAPGLTIEELEDELNALREEMRAAARDTPQLRGATVEGAEPADVLGSFWRFPDGLPVRIIGTPMFFESMRDLDYANRWHPNYMESLRNADMDATVELFGHLRATNPTGDVRFLTTEMLQSDDLTGHVVMLGGGDTLYWRSEKDEKDERNEQRELRSHSLSWFIRRLSLPVRTQLPEGGNPEYDTVFVVKTDEHGVPDYEGEREEVYRSTFLRDRSVHGDQRLRIAGFPQLEYDLGLLARQANPMNLQATVTLCSGVFSRGTYGAVRALTDVKLRESNEHYLRETFSGDEFWLLMRVPVLPGPLGAETITPDLTREYHVVSRSG